MAILDHFQHAPVIVTFGVQQCLLHSELNIFLTFFCNKLLSKMSSLKIILILYKIPIFAPGVLPILGYIGMLRPKGRTFLGLEVYERVGISRVEVYERVGISRSIGKSRENTS